MDDTRIVATRNEVGVQLFSHVEQALPLHALVAENAGIRHGSASQCLPERLDDLAAKDILHVDLVPGNSKLLALGFRPSHGAQVTTGTGL
jgi:hypothetical protein